MHKFTRFLLLLLAFQIVVSSCASTKRRDEQSALGKLWHNMNSHYNGYFNAKELMTENLLLLDEQHVDNYTQRLEMFPFLAVDNPSIVKEDLDKAVEKVAIVVKKHPYSNWVDDCYLLVGQAQLIQQDYESAEKTFRFLTNEFRPRPKRKKAKSRKSGKASEETSPQEEEAFQSRREVELSPEQQRKERIRARKEAEKERDRIRKERAKERKKLKKQRDKERKARARARKKGIKLPPIKRDTAAVAGLEDEPEEQLAMEDLGPIGMISIFNNAANMDGSGEQYGKKPDSYLVKHRPAFQDGRLWLAWTLIKRDNFDRAQLILEDLRADRGTFADVRRKAMAVQAFLYLEQNRLEEAIPYLEEAAAVAKERNERARYYYIAGQLNQELSQPAAAAENFNKAIAAAPDYELELGARLNLAQNAFLSGSGSPDEAIKKLQRMAKEEKNIPYESQIYFSMAAIALKANDKAAGKEYLRLALDSPSAGPVQQLEAYKLMGDLAYADNDYLPAKLYYDSTLTVMGQNDERFDQVSALRDKLAGIAELIQDIEVKDSLLRIGMLPEAARNQWAEDLFEKRRAAAAVPTNPVAEVGRTGRPAAPTLGNSNFWAYNPSTLRKSKRDFERQWGDRPLSDNWRRGSVAREDIFSDANDGGLADEGVQIVTEDEIKALLDGIPTTAPEQKTITIQQSENWFNLGREYRDRLEDLPKAIDAFETLNRVYPASSTEAESWYYLYLIHKQLGNISKAEEYAVKLRKYKGSKFARLANEPGYAEELLSKDNKLTREYETAYAAFEAGNYDKAHQLATKGRASLLGQHPLKPRYALLLAMTTGHLQGRPAYVAALRQVVAQFKGTPEETRAKEILRLLGETGARLPGRNGTVGGGFKESMKELHYVLIVFDDKDVKLNEAKLSAAEFNNKYNKLDRIRITNVYLGKENNKPVLVLRRFKTGEAAVSYVQNAKERNKEFLSNSKFTYTLLAVSQSNYREILKARSAEEYIPWYRDNYEQ